MLKNNYGEHTSDTSLIFRVVNHFSPKITMYNQCPSHYFSFRIVYLSTKIMKKKKVMDRVICIQRRNPTIFYLPT